MASSGLVRLSRVAGVLAGLAYVTSVVLDRKGPLDPSIFTSSLDYLVQYAFLFALAATMVAAAGLHVLQRRSAGWLGAAGVALALLGHLVFLYVTVEQINFGASAGPGFQQVGSLAVLAGLVLLGLATLNARVLPRWTGASLIVGGVLFVFAAAFSVAGPVVGPVVGMAVWSSRWALVGLLLGVVWASVGYALLSRGRAPTGRPAADAG